MIPVTVSRASRYHYQCIDDELLDSEDRDESMPVDVTVTAMINL